MAEQGAKVRKSSRSDTVLRSIRCGKSGLHLLPQSAGFASVVCSPCRMAKSSTSYVSQMRFTH